MPFSPVPFICFYFCSLFPKTPGRASFLVFLGLLMRRFANVTVCALVLNDRFLRPSRGGGGGGGGSVKVSVPFFPWNKSAFTMFPKIKACFYVPCSLKLPLFHVLFISRLLFPCSPEIHGLSSLFPKTPGRASFLGLMLYGDWIHFGSPSTIFATGTTFVTFCCCCCFSAH